MGLMLLYKGSKLFYALIVQGASPTLFTSWLIHIAGDMIFVALIFTAFILGFLKGHFVLRKSANRMIKKLSSLPNPTSPFHFYSPAFLGIIALMMLLGMSFSFFGLSPDIRGTIDIAIGVALIRGGMTFITKLLPSSEPAEN